MTPDEMRDDAAREYAKRYAGISVVVDFKAGWDAALRSVQPKPPFALHETWCSGQHFVDLAGSGECLSDEVLARLRDPVQPKPLTEEQIEDAALLRRAAKAEFLPGVAMRLRAMADRIDGGVG